jgi:hypothetical protein
MGTLKENKKEDTFNYYALVCGTSTKSAIFRLAECYDIIDECYEKGFKDGAFDERINLTIKCINNAVKIGLDDEIIGKIVNIPKKYITYIKTIKSKKEKIGFFKKCYW